MKKSSPRTAVEVLEARIAPATLLGLDQANHLVKFDSATPGTVSTIAVTGLGAGETLVGIDFRPATGGLYGLATDASQEGFIYFINATTGAATKSAVLVADPADTMDGNAAFTTLSGTNFGVDFDPSTDRLRVVSDANQNLRVNVDSGRTFTDLNLNPAGGSVVEAAQTNSFAGAASSSLFGLDVASDTLVKQNPPNNGTLSAVGVALGLDATGSAGFDIVTSRTAAGVATDTGLAALTVGGTTGLFSVDLVGGSVTSLGAIGTGTTALRGLTAVLAAPAATGFAVDTDTGHLIRFSAATPNLTTDVAPLTGLGSGETVLGLDFRPADGRLFLLTQDAAHAGHLYTVSTSTGAVSAVQTLLADPSDTTSPYTALSGTHFGMDFDPVGGALRVVSDSGQNLRVEAATGLVTTDTNVASAALEGAAHSSNFTGAASTKLFVLDAASGKLETQDPTEGTLTAVGSLGVTFSAVDGFDIRTNGQAFATLEVGGHPTLFSINLSTGAATSIGQTGAGDHLLGLALAPSGVLKFSSSTQAVNEGDGTATLTVQRTGGTENFETVVVKTADVTATAGPDYGTVSKVITFAPGETSKTVSVAITDDTTAESTETFTVALSDATAGAVLASPTAATVSITDNEPTISITNVSATEGDAGMKNFTFTVALSAVSTSQVTVQYATSDGSALAGSDYVATGGTVTIQAGQISGLIDVAVIGDQVGEKNEAFNVTLSSPSANARIADGTGIGTILNDDLTSVSGHTATYTDADGDQVTIAASKGTFTASNFTFVPVGTLGGLQLQSIDLTGAGFLHANVGIVAHRSAQGGDGFVNVGYVNATGNQLGNVVVAGDVGQVDAANLGSLTVQSLGQLGLSTQAAGGSLQSDFTGAGLSLGKLIVKSDLVNAHVVAASSIGPVGIVGSILGGSAAYSGSIESGLKIVSVNALNLRGGAGVESGSIIAKALGPVKLRGDLEGGHVLISGFTAPTARQVVALTSLTVFGSVKHGEVLAGFDRTGAPVNADAAIGKVAVVGDWIASNLSAGVRPGTDGQFGTGDDSLIPGGLPQGAIARIAVINVRGQLLGDLANLSTHFGFVAEDIGSFRTGTTLAPLTTGLDSLEFGAVAVREFEA